MQTLRLALDWSPNTIHSAFYVGLVKGWYSEAGIDLIIESPSDAYSSDETPARRVVNLTADMCLAPSESVISCATSESDKVRPIAIAAVLHTRGSAIVTLKSSGIDSLEKLSGKTYGSYGGRFEMAEIDSIIKEAGGRDGVVEVVPPKFDCFEKLLAGEIDSTWIFPCWEAVIAKQARNVDLNIFLVNDTCRSYGYSPVILAHPDLLTDSSGKSGIIKRFLCITQRAARYAVDHPEEAVQCLLHGSNNHHSIASLPVQILIESQIEAGKHYLSPEGNWGFMSDVQWSSWVDWLFEHNCITGSDGGTLPRSAIVSTELYTNEFLNMSD